MNAFLELLLVALAVGVLAWEFERYRTRFVKADLLTGIGFATGLLIMAFAPGVYDRIGAVFDIRQRFIVVSLLANLALLGFVLYLHGALRRTRDEIHELTRNLSVDQASKIGDPEKDIQIIIPAYNEADSIESVVESLPDSIRGYAVKSLVVSDGSIDETADQARNDATIVVEHPINQGQGGALQTGFELARRNEASIVVTMDADGQHPADELARLVEPIIEDEADFVLGSRYRGTDRSGNGVVRRCGIRAFTALINLLTKANVTDCTNGFRAISGPESKKLTLTEERFSAPELIIEAKKKGLRIRETPITVERRQSGETKKPQVRYAVGLLRTILSTWIR